MDFEYTCNKEYKVDCTYIGGGIVHHLSNGLPLHFIVGKKIKLIKRNGRIIEGVLNINVVDNYIGVSPRYVPRVEVKTQLEIQWEAISIVGDKIQILN